MTPAEQTILEEVRGLRTEQREDRKAIFGAIDEVRLQVTNIAVNGCAKQAGHADHEERVRSLETDRDKGKGMLIVCSSLAAAALTHLAGRIFK